MEVYSEKEKELFSSLACEDLLNQEPYVAYRTAAEFCFLSDYRGPSVDSVRRCLNALITSKGPHRLTGAFDSLIEIGVDTGWAVGHEFFVIMVKRQDNAKFVNLHKAIDKIYLLESEAQRDLDAIYGNESFYVKRLVAYLD